MNRLFINKEWSPLKKLLFMNAASGGNLKEYTATGNPVAFTTNVSKPLAQMLIPFTPVQEGSGDPSPENVRPITGWTGVTEYRTGRNLLDPNGTEYYNYTISGTGEYTTTSNDRICTGWFPCGSGVEITASSGVKWYSGAGGLWGFSFVGIAAFSKDKIFLGRNSANTVDSISYTTPANTAYIRFFMQYNNVSNPTPAIFSTLEIQLEFGSGTEYAPYSGTTIPITFPAEAGTAYGGTLDLTTGVLTVTHKRYRMKDYTFYNFSGNKTFYFQFTEKDKNSDFLICDSFPCITGSPNVDQTMGTYGNGTNDGERIFFYKTEMTSANDFNNWLQALEVDPYFSIELANPLTYQLYDLTVPVTLIGDNVIYTSTNGQNTVKYLKKG